MVTALLLSAVLALAADAGAKRVLPDAASERKAERLPLDQVVARMQKRYELVKDFNARFTQKYVNVAYNRTKLSVGEVTFKKPGRMRWDYEKPEAQMWLTTGTQMWMYEPQAKQAVKQDLKESQLPAALSFLMGKGKLTEEFDVSLANDAPYGTPADYRLLLKPKKPQSTYKAIYFIVDPKEFLVRETALVKAQGDVNQFTFTDVVVNGKVSDARFKWKPPAGVRVIDAGKLNDEMKRK